MAPSRHMVQIFWRNKAMSFCYNTKQKSCHEKATNKVPTPQNMKEWLIILILEIVKYGVH